MSDLQVARCLELHGARARFEIVTVHPDAMGRRFPFEISPFFVLQLLFEVVMDGHVRSLPAYDGSDTRDLAILGLSRELITKVEVVSTSNERISEEGFRKAFDDVDQDIHDNGESFLDQETGLPRARFDVEVTDPRLLAGMPLGRSWWSTAYAGEPAGEPPHAVVSRGVIAPRFPGDILRAELTAPPRTGRMAWDTPRVGDVIEGTISRPDRVQSYDFVVLATDMRGATRKDKGAKWIVAEAWTFVDGPRADLDGDWIGIFLREVAPRYSLTKLLPATATAVANEGAKLLRGMLEIVESARKEGEMERAILWCTRARTLAPPTDSDHAKALFLRASIRAEVGDHQGAMADWNTLLAEKPDHHGALMGSARTQIRLGKPASTLGELRRAVELGVDGAAELLRSHAAAPAASSKRVSHATYGEGTIIRQLPGDKLEIEFASSGKKILLARFVKPIE